MSFIFHWGNLVPFVFPDVVFFDGAKSLFARETTEHKDASFTNGDGMSVSTLSHLGLIQNFIFLRKINPGIFFRR